MSREEERPGELPEWVTAFDSPVVVAARDKPTSSRLGRAIANLAKARPGLVPATVGVGGAVGIAAIVFAALSRPVQEETGLGTPSASRTEFSPRTSTPTATVDAASSLIPEECADAYSEAMESGLANAGLELNSTWAGSRGATAGSADSRLLHLLKENSSLECYWLDKAGGDDSAVLTVIADANDAEMEAAMSRLTALELTRREEYGGTRFFGETVDAAGERYGESHFFREGIWFATRWYGYGPFGYSADMATSLFG